MLLSFLACIFLFSESCLAETGPSDAEPEEVTIFVENAGVFCGDCLDGVFDGDFPRFMKALGEMSALYDAVAEPDRVREDVTQASESMLDAISRAAERDGMPGESLAGEFASRAEKFAAEYDEGRLSELDAFIDSFGETSALYFSISDEHRGDAGVDAAARKVRAVVSALADDNKSRFSETDMAYFIAGCLAFISSAAFVFGSVSERREDA